MTGKRKPREVRVQPMSYSPTKVEMEEPIVIRKPDGSVPTPDELAKALGPVKLVKDPDA